MRIASLLPSATEILCALGLLDQLVGVTEACDFPPSVRSLPQIVRSRFDAASLPSGEIDTLMRSCLESGRSAYEVDVSRLVALSPDVILTQDLCEVCAVSSDEVTRTLGSLRLRPRVISLHPHTLEDILQDILRVGEALGVASRAQELVLSLRRRLGAIHTRKPRPRVGALEWLDPLMASGHWVGDQIRAAGGDDVLSLPGEASRRISLDEIVRAHCDVLVLMPCGFDEERTVREATALSAWSGWASLSAVRAGRVYAVNGGAYFSRPGPRVVDGVELLAERLWAGPPRS